LSFTTRSVNSNLMVFAVARPSRMIALKDYQFSSPE
jgi:hypothetical protein